MFGINKKTENDPSPAAQVDFERGNGVDAIRYSRTQGRQKEAARSAERLAKLGEMEEAGIVTGGVLRAEDSQSATAAAQDEVAVRVGEPGAPVVRVENPSATPVENQAPAVSDEPHDVIAA